MFATSWKNSKLIKIIVTWLANSTATHFTRSLYESSHSSGLSATHSFVVLYLSFKRYIIMRMERLEL